MATRPVFFPALPATATRPGIVTQAFDFLWVPGQAHVQRQKCARSLHSAILAELPKVRPLEISSKSDETLGVQLSALNLSFADGISVETRYQSAKCFTDGVGPFPEAARLSAHEARAYVREQSEGKKLIAFNDHGQSWPLHTGSLFYYWLYGTALRANPDMAHRLTHYTCFSDIEFNPAKSVSTQAAAAALFCSLHAFGQLETAFQSPEDFLQICGLSAHTFTAPPQVQPEFNF